MKLRVLDPHGAQQIHRTALKILNEIGVVVQDEMTRCRLRQAGCRDLPSGRLGFDDEIVARAIATVPNRLCLFDRRGQVAVDTGNPIPRFSPSAGCLEILDHTTGEHRPFTVGDVADTTRLCEVLNHIDLVQPLGGPCDVAPHEEALVTVRTMLQNSTKPFAFMAHDEAETAMVWQHLADVAGGWEPLAAKPFAMDLIGPSSPLELSAETCRRLAHAAQRQLPVVCYPGLVPGASGPVTLAGALAQAAAETLSGLVVHQLACPGAPVMSGAFILPMDMRTGSLCYGGPEYALACRAAGDYLGDLGIPCWSGAGCSDAHTVDAQAASEVGMNIQMALLGSTPLVHNLGALSSGKTGSLAMLVLCDELAAMATRTVGGVAVDNDTLGYDVIERASTASTFLSDDHTLAHARSESWVPSLFQRVSRSQWSAEGQTAMTKRLNERVRALLDS